MSINLNTSQPDASNARLAEAFHKFAEANNKYNEMLKGQMEMVSNTIYQK